MKRSLQFTACVAMVIFCAATAAVAFDNPNINQMHPGSFGEGVIDAVKEDGFFVINDIVVQFSPFATLRTQDDGALFINQLKAGDKVLFSLDDEMQIIWLMKLE